VLKWVRVAVSVAMLGVVTALCTVAWGAFEWAGALQIVPLALAGSVTGLVVWIGLTVLLGRVYCSSVCPLGTLQDCMSRLPRLSRRWRVRRPYHFEPVRERFRITWLIIIAGCGILGLTSVILWVDPYSTFGRMADGLLLRSTSFPVGRGEVVAASGLAFAIAVVTLVAVGYVSVRHGRLICNTVCPVGSSLGLLSRVSLMQFDIDTDLCTNCRACEYACKAQCIDLSAHTVDASRCVVCFNCMAACPDNAIRYTFRRKKLSLPLMEPVKPLPTPTLTYKTTTTTSSGISCNNISTFCSGYSATACRKTTVPEPAPEVCSDTRCGSTSPTDSPC